MCYFEVWCKNSAKLHWKCPVCFELNYTLADEDWWCVVGNDYIVKQGCVKCCEYDIAIKWKIDVRKLAGVCGHCEKPWLESDLKKCADLCLFCTGLQPTGCKCKAICGYCCRECPTCHTSLCFHHFKTCKECFEADFCSECLKSHDCAHPDNQSEKSVSTPKPLSLQDKISKQQNTSKEKVSKKRKAPPN